MTPIEKLARLYCEELGHNPDTMVRPGVLMASIPLWRLYQPKAEAALAPEAMQRALARLLSAD
jgi:hypothetical protein